MSLKMGKQVGETYSGGSSAVAELRRRTADWLLKGRKKGLPPSGENRTGVR